jgi:hypothetical protein
MHIKIAGRGSFAEKRDDKSINYIQGFAERAKVHQGWIIIHGRHFYSFAPVTFPEIGTPDNVRIHYPGYADGPIEKEDDREMVIDWGWRGLPEPEFRVPSLSELPEVEIEEEDSPPFVNVWEQKQETDEGVKQE